jgi:hypothetical protein
MARDALRVYTLRDPGGALIAVAPMVLTSRPAAGPLQLRELRFFGADPNLTELRGMVCEQQHFELAFAALLQHVSITSREWHQVSWSGIRLPPEEWPARGYSDLAWRRSIPDLYLELPASWEEFRARLPRNIRESLRKCYNSLARAGHAFEVRVIADPGPAQAALATFFRLHAARAQLNDTIVHPDIFGDAAARDFLGAYTQQMARLGQLRIFQLAIGGEVVATRVAFQFERSLYLYYSGYDPAWAPFSVMTTVVAEALKWSIANGVTVFNLSTGDDVSKTRWRPSRALTHEAIQRTASPLVRTGIASVVALRAGWRSGRRRLLGARHATRGT